MLSLGVDLSERPARAVVVQYAGTVLARGGAPTAVAWLTLNPVERRAYRRLGSLAAVISTGVIARRLSRRIQARDISQVLDAADADLMLEAVRQESARRLPPQARSDLRVEFSSLGSDAAAIGAPRPAMTSAS